MARFSVTVRANHSSLRPHLKWVVNCNHPGKGRTRIYFETKEQAEAAAHAKRIEVENHGIQALELSPTQRLAALDAFEKLKPLKVTLTEVVNDYLERRRSSNATMSEVVAMYLESRTRKGRSERHISSLRYTYARFNKTFASTRLSDFTADQIQTWIDLQPGGASTHNHYRTKLHGVFEYAVKRLRIIWENPVAQIEPETVKNGVVGILTPDRMRIVLELAMSEPDVLATMAIGGFAGIRPEEIKRLKRSAILLDRGVIDCGSEITKTAQHRYVKIEPVLAAWLKVAYPKFVANDSPIQEENFRRRYDAIRIKAGFSVRGSEGIPWPHDALRHSFGSYHLAHFKNAAVTALEMGHQGTNVLFKHYRARVSLEDAAQWWQLMPKLSQEQPLALPPSHLPLNIIHIVPPLNAA